MAKVAVVGAGYWGKNLVRVFYQLGALKAVCDSSSASLKRISSDYPALATTLSYDDILKDESIRAAVIAAPAESHYKLAKEAILAGKDIFVEKPLATDVRQGEELVELAAGHGRILMVGHILEYHPAISHLKELIAKGELGKINYIYSNRLNLGKVRREENILWSFAPHDISVMLLLLNEIPESVSVYGGNFLHHDVADVTVTNLSFSSGVKGHIFVSWLHPYKEQRLVIVGDKKMAVFDDVSEKDKLLLFSHKMNLVKGVPVYKKEDAKRIEFKSGEPLLLEASHFLECIKTRKAPKTDGRSAMRVLKVLSSCQTSLEKGGTLVPIDQNERTTASHRSYYSHPTSVVDEPCKVGAGTKIWHYSHIMKGAVVGKDCIIGQNVFIGSKTQIGDGSKIQNNVSIYDRVKLEEDVFCGPSVVFTNVINPRSHISRNDEFKETRVKKGATLGANATIICGVTIGEYAFVGAGAVVTRDIPPFALAYGNPARIKGWVCTCAEKLDFKKERARCKSCGSEYMLCKGSVKGLNAEEKRPSKRNKQ